MSQMKTKKIFNVKSMESYGRTPEFHPRILYISVHEVCNENCVFCVVKGGNEGKFGKMTLAGVKTTIRKFVGTGGKDIVFTGGEPTLRNDLPEMVRYAVGLRGLKSVSVITNGVRLATPSYLKELIRADTANKLGFCFSFHSHKRNISELLTDAPGTFNKTIAGINAVVMAGKRVSVYHVITSKNYKDLLLFSKFVHQQWPSIKDITLAYPFPQGNAVLNNWIYVKFGSLRPYLLRALRFLEKFDYTVNIAACGQFPLCIIPGFEEVVVRPLLESEANISGVVGEKSFHEFEMASDEWVGQYKTSGRQCRRCAMRFYCQGFWKQYVSLFGLEGIQPVKPGNFKGNLIRGSINSAKELLGLEARINARKMNLIILKSYQGQYLRDLLTFLRQGRILAVVQDGRKIHYPVHD